MAPEAGGAAVRSLLDPHSLARIGRLSLVARYVVEGVVTGMHRSPYRGFSTEFTEHRPYAPGDEIRRIDWKAYGRLDRYFVKEYEEETNLKAWIMVDCSASMAYGDGLSKYRYASILAASLAYLLLQQRDAVGLATYADRMLRLIQPRSTFSHLEVIAGELEGRIPTAATDAPRAIEELAAGLRRRSLIIIISDLLDDPQRLGLALKQLRHKRNEVIVFQVLHRDELELPFRRPALFLDPEGDGRVTTSPDDIRNEYRRIVDDWRGRIRSLCHANYVDYELLSTAMEPDIALVRYLARRAAQG